MDYAQECENIYQRQLEDAEYQATKEYEAASQDLEHLENVERVINDMIDGEESLQNLTNAIFSQISGSKDAVKDHLIDYYIKYF